MDSLMSIYIQNAVSGRDQGQQESSRLLAGDIVAPYLQASLDSHAAALIIPGQYRMLSTRADHMPESVCLCSPRFPRDTRMKRSITYCACDMLNQHCGVSRKNEYYCTSECCYLLMTGFRTLNLCSTCTAAEHRAAKSTMTTLSSSVLSCLIR
jgi:hypothetical protein